MPGPNATATMPHERYRTVVGGCRLELVADFDNEASPHGRSPEWPSQVDLVIVVHQALGVLMHMHGCDLSGAVTELAAQATGRQESLEAMAREIIGETGT